MTGVAVVTVCAKRLRIEWGPTDFLWFIVMIFCGTVIYFAVFLLLTAVSFWFEDRVGIVPPIYNMLTFGRYPLTIYNLYIQFLLSWIIPFAFASFYPVTHFLGREDFAPLFRLVPVVALAFAILARIVWDNGVRNYSSTGS